MSKQIQVVSSESVANIELCGQNSLGATHVVTEVKTGFNAILTIYDWHGTVLCNKNLWKSSTFHNFMLPLCKCKIYTGIFELLQKL